MKSDLIISKPEKRTREQLKRLQSLPLEQKINLSLRRIDQFYREMGGKVYVSFSGGKDSTVLLHLVRRLFPKVKGVYVNTGVEFPGINDFVKKQENITWLKPKMSFASVLKKYGFPVVSKKISMGVSRYRNTGSEIQKHLRLYGGINPTSGKRQEPTVSKKWHYLIDSDIKISERCCDVLKKAPVKQYHKKTGLHPITGEMAGESELRRKQWLSHGCNGFDLSIPKSTPLSFWSEGDIWEYVEKYNIEIASPYMDGEKRTGCMFCLYGAQYNDSGGWKRFERMKEKYPLHYRAAEKWGVIKALELIRSQK